MCFFSKTKLMAWLEVLSLVKSKTGFWISVYVIVVSAVFRSTSPERFLLFLVFVCCRCDFDYLFFGTCLSEF